jgi:hypothetical protein
MEALPQRCITLRPQIDVNVPCQPDAYFAPQIMGKEERILAAYAVGGSATRSR